jgi:hypothetical protein
VQPGIDHSTQRAGAQLSGEQPHELAPAQSFCAARQLKKTLAIADDH